MNQKETMAYLAGIIDGEGFLEIRKTTTSVGNVCYSARMSFLWKIKLLLNYLPGFLEVKF